jgi:hypothetical protein
MTYQIFAGALALAAILAVPAAARQEAGTSFQTAEGWHPGHDIRSDVAIVASNLKERIASWAERGYTVWVMGGFRTGPDYISQYPEDGQTTRDGTILTCGPGSYYTVPTERRIQASVDYYLTAVRNGARAVMPEEPEYFAVAGYSQSFKDEWQRFYGEPWQDPASSHDARIKSERLKMRMQYHLIERILQAVQQEDPSVLRVVAHHSPVNYHSWGISFPFDDFARMPEMQEVVGQVWTGTARSACMYRGEMKERTFENGYLEYSSLVELYRGRGKRLWFLADPLEDNPDRTMEDYRSNYEHTLVASLMFPEVNAFELLPWPNRIYGRIPEDYATALGCAFNALREISRMPARRRPGTGLGVLIGDSAAYQRAEPDANNLNGFYGLSLPFVYRGIPVRVAPVERAPDAEYLRSFHTLLVSFDYFKPMDPAYNRALAAWVRQGGHLILVGGSNSYNQANQWWKRDGFQSPDEHLLRELGLQATRAGQAGARPVEFRTVLVEEREIRDLSNLEEREIPLPEGLKEGDSVAVRIGDSRQADGWGGMVTRIRIQKGGESEIIRPGTAREAALLVGEQWTVTTPGGGGRFADGPATFTYLFPAGPGTRVFLTIGNQFRVDVAAVGPEERQLLDTGVTRYSFTGVRPEPLPGHPDDGSAFRWKCGDGTLTFFGASAESFARDSGGAQELVDTATARASAAERTSWRREFLIRRGPYVAVHPMTEEVRLRGRYINLLDHTLRPVQDPVVQPGQSRLLRLVEDSLDPQILAASYEATIVSSTEDAMEIRCAGPLGTPAAMRIHTAGRQVESVACAAPSGQSVDHRTSTEGDTLYVTFPGSPDGVTVTISWRKQP